MDQRRNMVSDRACHGSALNKQRALRAIMMAVGLFASVLATGNPPASQQSDKLTGVSRSGQFHLMIESELDPIVINRIHRWVLRVETADGHPVSGAQITIQGGRPEHNHGLPTVPHVTASPDAGGYLIEGIRFHMSGYWELEFTISTGKDEDTVLISLEL